MAELESKQEKHEKYDKGPLNFPEFLVKHFSYSTIWTRGMSYTASQVTECVKGAIEHFKKEPTLRPVEHPCIIVGDLHGNFVDLVRILNVEMNPERKKRVSSSDTHLGFNKNRFVFLGNYIDIGERSLECIVLLFTLKIMFPSNYVLLRGNHEIKSVNEVNGFLFALESTFGTREGKKLWSLFNTAFSYMPLAALVSDKILCVHSGISPHLNSLDDIRSIKKPLRDLMSDKLAVDLVFADPLDYDNAHAVQDEAIYKEHKIGISYKFNDAAIKECVETLNLDFILFKSGFRMSADRKMITLFSATNFSKKGNRGAILKIHDDGGISFTIIEPNPVACAMNDESGKSGYSRSENSKCPISNPSTAAKTAKKDKKKKKGERSKSVNKSVIEPKKKRSVCKLAKKRSSMHQLGKKKSVMKSVKKKSGEKTNEKKTSKEKTAKTGRDSSRKAKK